MAGLVGSVGAVPVAVADSDECVASTVQGPVVGVKDGDLCAFKGIPYAFAPEGNLRWQPPHEPPSHLGNPLIASRVGNVCVQWTAHDDPTPKGAEDCLFLNIWRPDPSLSNAPVMVWIHGGGNRVGAGSDPYFDGAALAKSQGVVVVTINYRLGVFGFYGDGSSGPTNPPTPRYFPGVDFGGLKGNYGLLDQLAALRWIEDNAAFFGGNPNNVTVFGTSAGANDICHLLTSDLSEGLFDKAILQSGACKKISSVPEAASRANEIESLAGCAADPDPQCMKNLPAYALFSATRHDPDELTDAKWLAAGAVRFKPYVDGVLFEKQPMESIREGSFHRVPVLAGLNRHEQNFFLAESFADIGQDEDEYIAEIMPDELNVTYEELKNEYGLAGFWSRYAMIRKVWGDYTINCLSLRMLERIAARQPLQTYQYRFDYDYHNLAKAAGATHGMEVGPLFDALAIEDTVLFTLYQGPIWNRDKYRRAARDLVSSMQRYWGAFAWNDQPASHSEWPLRSSVGNNVMVLDLPLARTNVDADLRRCEFLEERGATF